MKFQHERREINKQVLRLESIKSLIVNPICDGRKIEA